jgi:hypothetical protein
VGQTQTRMTPRPRWEFFCRVLLMIYIKSADTFFVVPSHWKSLMSRLTENWVLNLLSRI